MNTKLIGKYYIIKEEGTSRERILRMGVNINEQGRVTIVNQEANEDFRFINSSPEMVIKIGKMITEAGMLAIGMKKTEEGGNMMYCIACKTKRHSEVEEECVTFKNGKKGYKGVCGLCNTIMFKVA